MSFSSTSNPEYSNFIALSKYARWLPEQKRRETWEETVERYINFFAGKFPTLDKDNTLNDLFDAIYYLEVMPSMRALMTAGIALEKDNVAGFNCSYRETSGSGEALEILTEEMKEAGITEAVTISVNKPIAFDEIMYILMCGTGVGFSAERQFVSQLPIIGHKLPRKTYYRNEENYPGVAKAELSWLKENIIQVTDSKYGWASALRILLIELYNGNMDITWDTSRLREAGAPLKTFGGRASGPEPLINLFNYIVKLFKKAQGRKLNSIEVHGLVCKIAEIVVVGGVRRSALISLSNLSDDRMRHAKSGQWWDSNPEFSLANNSVCYTEKPSSEVFMREWLSLMESKSGERGIFNREASKLQALKNGRRDESYNFGTNPCCVTGDTKILTSEGYKNIDSLVGKEVAIWNGVEYSTVIPFETGVQPVYKVILSDGTDLTCTKNHKFILDNGRKTKRIDGKKVDIGRHEIRKTVEELTIGDKLFKYSMPIIEKGIEYSIDAYSQGFYSGDGNTDLSYSMLYEPKYVCAERLIGTILEEQKAVKWKHGEMLKKDFVPIDGSLDYKINWLAGLLDSDGTVANSSYQISSINLSFLKEIQLMLTTVGVKAKINKLRDSTVKDFNDGYGEYNCQPCYRLLINQTDSQLLIKNGLVTNRLSLKKQEVQRDARRFAQVQEIIDLNTVQDTYCFTEDKNHTGTFNGIVTGQSEIILRNQQFCNLTEIVIRATDTLADLIRKAKYAARLGTLQATLTDFKYLNPEWKKNTEEEALLGVSMTGIMDHPLLSGELEIMPENWYTGYDQTSGKDLSSILEYLRAVVVEENRIWAKKLGIKQAAATTAVKPSGTVSQLVDSASGIHTRYSEYYIRTVRADTKDPLAKMMLEAGFPAAPDVMNPAATLVFSFPIKAPDIAVFRNDRTAIEQLEHWLVYQRHWCEHKPSVTVYVKDEEWPTVGSWVWEHFDEISGVSFLPHSDHSYRQAPYQEISEAEYNDWVEIMPKDVDWSDVGLYEQEDNTTSSQTMACSGGVCEIVDLT